MSATDATADAAALADGLRTAPFVRVVATADGDALAAAGAVARALDERGVPFQVRVTAAHRRVAVGGTDPDGDDTFVLVVGTDVAGADGVVTERPASAVAHGVVEALDAEPEPLVTLAGLVAATVGPGVGTAPDGAARSEPTATPVGEAALAAAGDRVARRPGVGVPTADVGDGLAHSTLVHAPFSGEPERAQALLADLDLPAEPDDDDRRRLGSVVAVDATTADGTAPGAADAVGDVLRPHAVVAGDGPFATVEGFADVLEAVAHERPGVGVALVLRAGDDGGLPAGVRTAALEAWRTHATAAHDACRTAAASLARHSGVVVARLAGADPTRLPTVARLVAAYRAPEPVAVVIASLPDAGTDAAGDAATHVAGESDPELEPDRGHGPGSGSGSETDGVATHVAAVATGPTDDAAAVDAGAVTRRTATATGATVTVASSDVAGARVGDPDAFVTALREGLR